MGDNGRLKSISLHAAHDHLARALHALPMQYASPAETTHPAHTGIQPDRSLRLNETTSRPSQRPPPSGGRWAREVVAP